MRGFIALWHCLPPLAKKGVFRGFSYTKDLGSSALVAKWAFYPFYQLDTVLSRARAL